MGYAVPWLLATLGGVGGCAEFAITVIHAAHLLLQGLMSLLDQDAYGDVDDFLEKYGNDTPSLEQIRALQVGRTLRATCKSLCHTQRGGCASSCYRTAE